MGKTESIIRRFPDFYQTEDTASLLYQFVDVFGQTLNQAEIDLLKVMRAHWVDTADNEGSQGFDTAQKGDLDKIFSLYLENLGGTSQLKQVNRRSGPDGLIDDAHYRERIKGLIQVLKGGASTKEGIITIVAANLGIVGDDEAAAAARQTIRIVEFLPQPFPVDFGELALSETIVVENPNVVAVNPEIRIRALADLPVPLFNPRLINPATGQFGQYQGTISAGDVLSFFPDSSAMLNGVPVPLEGGTPSLPPGSSTWRFEAIPGLSKGRFDQDRFNFATFEKDRLEPVGEFTEKVVQLAMTLPKLTPGAFTVRIPWDIPGYTDKFDEFGDHPRNQIKFIVNKVKAAGVFAEIAYEKRFGEIHQAADSLAMSGERQPLTEDQGLEERNFDIGSTQTPYPGGLEHELADSLITRGVFDMTTFDSLNTFA